MPLEGHADRLATPLSSRERRALLGLAGVLAALVIAFALYSVVNHSSSPEAGCIDVVVPASVGGASIHRCGEAARRLCATQSGISDEIAQACKREGYPTR
jgi:hypothetical protein